MNTTQQAARTHRRESHGFTIVEIMVAMAISLILLLGVINIFMASKTSYTLQSGAARLQENARFALDFISRSVGMAGLNMAPSPAFTVANTLDGGGNASDSIQVNYKFATDCLGNPTGASGVASDLYDIRVEAATGVSNLYCNNQPLVEGIENMQILYGQDSDADGVADSYVSAANVTDWGSANGGIASIRIALLVSTVDDAGATDNTPTFRLLNAPALGPFNDNMLRRVFTRTILVRNYTFTP